MSRRSRKLREFRNHLRFRALLRNASVIIFMCAVCVVFAATVFQVSTTLFKSRLKRRIIALKRFKLAYQLCTH